ncbi:inositol monophosphatase family protein [Thiofilum flexile]|uniref:inositol monophosphatase family protein n=1 Tax=Thiofilum flexile TaxID=125627 RepID=UPI000382CB23|nr:inositol monophosphatase family protein [Thiofilum flexile]
MHPMLYIAIKAAREAGELISRYANKVDQLKIDQKDPNDFVSEIDRQAERTIVSILRRAYPEHTIMGEEFGRQGQNDSDYEWVIDPLDGTTNYLRSLGHCAVSIALKTKGRVTQGVVFDPIRDELFAASRGDGATLNNRRIRVSNLTTMQGALLATGIPFRAGQNLELYLETMKVLVPNTAGVRRAGAAALDLAYVACGRYDGFWEFNLHEWDMAAGILLIQEAGGLVGDLQGGNSHLSTGNVLAANPKVFKEMVQRLHPVLS